MTMFTPIGDKARWRLIYDEISRLAIGDLITHDDLERAADTPHWRQAYYRAVRELEQADHRTLDVERGIGYRVIPAAEHERVMFRHQKRSRRQLTTAKRKIASADKTQLDAETARRFDDYELRMSQAEQMIRRLHKRVAAVEASSAQSEQRHAAQGDKIALIVDTLRKHGLLDAETNAA